MLISFALHNYKSFRDRAELNLIAKRADRTIPGAAIPVELPGLDGDALLPATAIYGPNASGKSNFLLGLRTMKLAVEESQAEWKPTSRVPVDPHVSKPNEPTIFEVEILINGIRWRYGFSANQRTFLKEWLYSYPLGRERELFVRVTEGGASSYQTEVNIGRHFLGSSRDHDSIKRRVRHNSLFLSAAAQDNQEDSTSIYKWFHENLSDRTKIDFDEDERGLTSALAYDFPKFKSLLMPLLRMSDSSIEDVLVEDRSSMPARDSAVLLERIKTFSVAFSLAGKEGNYNIEFDKESRGVKRLYIIAADLITALFYGEVVFVDELETSMHAHVASQILALFQNKASNPRGAQMIFTTHETRLLNLQHLRRDQVWFCDREGLDSQLYPLTEFSPRKDENFEASYLKGRYGAVPQAVVDPSWIAEINDPSGDSAARENA